MANDVFANGREISCKAADGKAVAAFPDVCFTPPQTPATPPGVPIPYPNTAFAKDTTKGSKKVKISNKPVMLKNKSYFKTSTGDEGGSAPKKGIITSKIKGKVYFNMWSMDVKFEGQNVVRHLDLTTHNHGSQAGQTPPWPYMDSMNIDLDPCKTEKENEEKTCEEYKPNGEKDVCSEAELSRAVIQKDLDAITEGFSGVTAWSDDKSRKAAANKCISARRCKLVPYEAEKDGIDGCCPSQTADHVIPKSSFFTVSFDNGQKLDSWKKYDYKKAPCMCAEGGSNTHGTHGLRHAHHKANGPGSGTMQSFNKEARLAAEGTAEVFKPSSCSVGCIVGQLKNGHSDFGDKRTTVKHSPSGSSMTNDQIQTKASRYVPETVAR